MAHKKKDLRRGPKTALVTKPENINKSPPKSVDKEADKAARAQRMQMGIKNKEEQKRITIEKIKQQSTSLVKDWTPTLKNKPQNVSAPNVSTPVARQPLRVLKVRVKTLKFGSPSKKPVVLYKYLEEQWAVKMLEDGNIRVGTLYEYRDHWNDQIRDVEEGTFTSTQDIHGYVGDGSDLTGLVAQSISITGSKNVRIGHMSVEMHNTIPNYNIYCTTIEGSREVMTQFNAQACIEIFDVEGFFNAVTNAMKARNYSDGGAIVAECSYNGRKVPYEVEIGYEGMPIGYWLKTPFYAPQKEMRALFIPAYRDQVIAPRFMDVPEIKKFIRRKEFN